MTDPSRRDANLSIPTIPNLGDVEVREAEPGLDESTDVVVRHEMGDDLAMPTAPSFTVPGLPHVESGGEGTPPVSVVDSLIAESLAPGLLPRVPTLSSLLVTPRPVAQDTPREPLRSLADQVAPSVRETPLLPAEARPLRAGLWVALIGAVLLASAAVVVVMWLRLH